MPNLLKEIWKRGQPTANGWCSIGSPFSAEIMAAQGFDSITVDLQHGAQSYTDALPMIQAINSKDSVPLARVPWREPGIIMKMLDAGAMGIICPMINSGEEAAEFASYVRYPPLGQRSYGPTRASIADPDFNVADANRDVLAFAMIETADGMKNLADIAKTPGIDGLYVGPSDLTLGVTNGRLAPGFDRTEPEMVDAIREILTAAKENGKFAALHCGSPDYAAEAIGWGFDMVTLSGDVRILANAARKFVTDFRGFIGKASPNDDPSSSY